jgi:hypothetical protein
MSGDQNTLHLRNCWVCGNPFESVKASARCCRKPECRAELLEIDSLLMAQYLLTNMRVAGGEGWGLDERPPTMYPRPVPENCEAEELMRVAIRQLPLDEGPLGDMLIALLEDKPPACLPANRRG